MNARDIGIVYNELRSKRVLFGGAALGHRRSEGEIAAVNTIKNSAGRLGDLEDFLATQGLKLITRESSELGLPGLYEIYIAVRNPLVAPPIHVCGDQLLLALGDSRRDETTEELAIWSVFLVLLLLNQLYTEEHRPIEAVSQFKDTMLDVEEFLEVAGTRIEGLRALPPPEDSRRAAIFETLTSLSEQRLEGRIRSFFKAMTDLGMLERVDNVTLKVEGGRIEPAYRQTLWSAVDLAENFRRYAPHLDIGDIAEQVDTIGSEEKVIDAADLSDADLSDTVGMDEDPKDEDDFDSVTEEEE